MFMVVTVIKESRITVIHSSWMISKDWASVPTYTTMEELKLLFSKHTAIIDGAPVHKVECLQQAGCLEDAWNSISQLDLDASIITLPMVGLSSTLSPKRRISSTPFCPTSIVPFSSTPSTSAVIPSPASPLFTPASGTADNSRSMCEICSSNEQGNTILRAILEAIHVLEMKVDMFKKSLRNKCSVDARLGSGGDELTCLPVAAPYRTVQDFDCGELVLMNEQKKKLSVRFLSRFEGGKLCSVMRKICQCLFSDKFAQNFSWTNVRRHGRKLKGSNIMLVIRGMALTYLRTIL
ncbi:hypothetical protein EG68_07624, partial [Paragonimus skrjabini miyazakii]